MSQFTWDAFGDFDVDNFREVTQGWFNWTKNQATEFFQKYKAHPVSSIVFATSPDPMKYWAAIPGNATVENKEAFIRFLRLKVTGMRALGVASMHEAWSAPEHVTDTEQWARESPNDWSKLPGVREILQVALETRERHYLSRATVTRNEEGVPTLGPWKDLPDDVRLGGQFSGYWLI